MAACKAAYQYGEEWYQAAWKYIQENLKFLKEYLQKELPEIKVIEPEGTYLVWLDFRAYGLCGEELSEKILTQAKLWLDDGYIFGKMGTGFERINLATSRSVLAQALERLKMGFSQN